MMNDSIAIQPAQNGVVLEVGEKRIVFVMAPGHVSQSVHDLLKEVAMHVAQNLEICIDVRDPVGREVHVAVKPKQILSPSDMVNEYPWSLGTLSDWRSNGKGPAFMKLGEGRRANVYYRREDVEAFLLANRIQTTEKA